MCYVIEMEQKFCACGTRKMLRLIALECRQGKKFLFVARITFGCYFCCRWRWALFSHSMPSPVICPTRFLSYALPSIFSHKHKLHFRHFTLDRLQLYNISEWNLYLLFHPLHITGCIPLPFISRRRSKNEQTYLVVNLIEIVINVDFKKMLPFHLYWQLV